MPSRQMPLCPSMHSRNKLLQKYRQQMKSSYVKNVRHIAPVSSNTIQSAIPAPDILNQEDKGTPMPQPSVDAQPSLSMVPSSASNYSTRNTSSVNSHTTPQSKPTRIGRRLIEDFLLPALNEGKYGDLLKWIDRDKRYFSIRWSHKNAAKWSLADTVVFQDWDRLKGHYHPEVKGYYMQAKQRFRAALYKLNGVKKMPCEEKHVKKYQLLLNHEKRHHDSTSRRTQWSVFKDQDQKSIPTPVICRNTSFIAKPQQVYADSSWSSDSPPSSPVSVKSEELECLQEYTLAQSKQILQNNSFEQSDDVENIDSLNDPMSDDGSPMNSGKTRHVPIQPVPLYSKCSMPQALMNSQKRVESPHVLLVKTYNDDDYDETELPLTKKIKVENDCMSNNNNEEDTKNILDSVYSDCALNLSTKCDDLETLSR